MESPCVKFCVLDPASGLCGGCGRTLDEIAQWSELSEEERRKILADLPRRMKQLRPD